MAQETQAQIQDAKSFLNTAPSNSMRPFIDKKGNSCMYMHNKGPKDDIRSYKKVPVHNASLRYDEWREVDRMLVGLAEQRLVGFADLRQFGLVHSLNNPLATTVLTYQKMSDAMEAQISIDPIAQDKGDKVDISTAHIPIPVVHSGFQIGERELLQSRKLGNGLDVTGAERSTRKVLQKLEDMLFGATTLYTYGGGSIYTYVTEPNINTVTLSVNWDASAKTAAGIIDEVLAMKSALINDHYFGPYVLYIPTDYETVLDEDYNVSGASLKTVRQRILDIEGISAIRVVDRLPDDNVLLVSMQRDVVDLIDGMAPRVVQWDTQGGLMHYFKVMAIQLPRVKSDYNGASGVCKLSA